MTIMRQHRIAFAVAAALVAFPSFAAITGTVMTKEGQPLAGARVSIHDFETAEARRVRLLSKSPEQVPIASTQTDSKGNFSLESPENAVVSLRIFARGYEPLVRGVERDEEVGAIALPVSEMRSGSVTAGGKPLANATIAITINTFEYLTRSDDQGRYETPDPKRASSIVVLHPDYAVDATPFMMRGAASPADLNRKLVAGSRFEGRVVGLDGQTPVANATITVDGWPLATSGEDGAFTIAHMPPKWTSLAARKEMLIGERSYSKEAAQTIRMQRAATISGRVADSKRSSPVPGVEVRAAHRRFGGFDTSVTAKTDAKGRYELVVPAGAYTLFASHPAYGPVYAEASVAPGQQSSHDITIAPLARISGTVIDETRRPVAVATVSVEDQGPQPGRTMMIRTAASDAASGPDGRFSVRVPGDEEIRLKATKKGLPAVSSDPLRVAPGERKTNVVLTIPSGIVVTGRVTDRDDNPLSGTTVTATKAESGPRGMIQRVMIGGMPQDEEDAVRTASDGTFTMRLEEGTYHFSFRREGYAQSIVNAQSVSPSSDNVVDARLEPAVEIHGRVVRGGAGVEGVRVIAMLGGGRSTETASDGSFTLGGLSPGDLRLMFMKQEEFIQEMRTATAPEDDLVVELPAGGRIRGRVVEKDSRKPITSFRVGVSGARSGGGMIRMGPTQQRQFDSEDGSFTLDDVPAGATTLVVTAPGYVESRANVEVAASKTVADVEVELDRGVRLTGRVTGPNGAPLSDVSVSIGSQPAIPLPPGMGTRATTNADGEYTIESLEAGPQQVDFRHAKYLGTRKEVTLKGSETRLDAQLTSGQRVAGVVVDEAGAPVPDARVTASGAAGAMGSARTATDGTFEFDSLNPGRYRFTASKSGYADGIIEDQDVSGGAPIRLTLSAGGTIYGRVIGLPERDLANVTVEARAGRSITTAAVDAAGNYRIEGAPTGTVQVTATMMTPSFSGRRSSGVQTVELSAGGARNVDLEFADDTTVTGRVTRNAVPLTGATISFMPRVGRTLPSVSVTTDSEGRYAASGLDDGEYNVAVVDMQSFSPYTTTYQVRGSGTFDISFKSSSIRGRVVDASTNEPISDASVQFRAASEELFRGGRGAVTDVNGTFVVDNVAAGAYVVTAAKSGYGNEIRELTVGDSGVNGLELKLARNDGVTLKVVDARDGRPLNATVSVFDMQGRLVHERNFFFGGSNPSDARLPLAPGTYTASVGAIGYAPRSITFSAPSTQSVALTPGGKLLIQSKHPSPRIVRVIDSNGMPYPRQGTRPPFTTLLPSPGTTRIDHLAPGTYTLQLLGENEMVVETATVVIREGEVVTISI